VGLHGRQPHRHRRALHAAFSCPATRFLDLDGHLDLATDFATGGFTLQDGVMRLLDRPGLGVDAAGALPC
jgi:L-alanine-DL-glutamate epimerase-like enolase superfamily enzyme